MPEENILLNGRCLCGSIEIETKKANINIAACHCNLCRRWTGGPLLVVTCGNKVTITDPSGTLSTHQTSDYGERAFCSNCGSGLYYHYFEDDNYCVPAGLFEFDGFKLNRQIFIDEKPSYYSFSNDTKELTGETFCNLKYQKASIEIYST